MTERQPTSSLSAFRGLSSATTPTRRFGADMLATTSLVVGAAVSSAFAVIAFGAALLVLETSSVAGFAPTTVLRAVSVAAAAVSLVGVVAGLLALWWGHVDGAGVAVRATIGLATSALWPIALLLGFGSIDDATRDAGVISRPGFLPYDELARGDCLVEVPPAAYDSADDQVYGVRCELSHRAQVMSVVSMDVAGRDTPAAAAEAACASAPVDFELESTDRVVAVRPVDPAQSSSARVVCVIAHPDDRRFGATDLTPPDDPGDPAS